MKTTEEKFWDRVERQEECLIWIGPIDTNTGIGRFRCDRIDMSARRFAFILAYTNSPMLIRTNCGNIQCVSVDHLVSGERQLNPQYGVVMCQIEGCERLSESRGPEKKPRRICSSCSRKGLVSPESDLRRKMTPKLLESVLELYSTGMTQTQIGNKLGFSTACIQKNIARVGRAPGKGRGTSRLYPETPEGFKWCNKCQEIKSIEDFWAHKDSQDGLTGACKECMAEQHKLNRSSMRHLAKKAYGLTLEEYDTLMATILFCPICGDPTTDLDHDGETGLIRSPLCGGCNRGLGQFSHCPERLRKAAEYMEKYNQ